MALERFQIPGGPTCRVVYPRGLFEKLPIKGAPEADPKYNAWILIPKSDEEKATLLMDKYMEAFDDLKKKGFKKNTWQAIEKKQNCLIDGDEYADEEEGKDAFRGYWIVKIGSKTQRPMVMDKEKRRILNGKMINGLDVDDISPEELQDGDYILANISFWTYCAPAYQGIGANLNALVRVLPGEQIGGMSTNVEDYIDFTYA